MGITTKLHYHTGPQKLRDILSQLQHPFSTHEHQRHARHKFQLDNTLPRSAPGCLWQAFPYCIPRTWDSLPCAILLDRPHPKGLQKFNTMLHSYLQTSNWLWPTDFPDWIPFALTVIARSLPAKFPCPRCDRKIPSCCIHLIPSTDFSTSSLPYLQIRMVDTDLETLGSSEFSIPHERSYSVASTAHCASSYIRNIRKIENQAGVSPTPGKLHLSTELVKWPLSM